jgi:hypothetical protein
MNEAVVFPKPTKVKFHGALNVSCNTLTESPRGMECTQAEASDFLREGPKDSICSPEDQLNIINNGHN